MPTWFDSIKFANSEKITWDDAANIATIEYNPKNNVYFTTTATICDTYYNEPKHFNCKHCGAPNQIDVCKYCGSAYE